MGTYEYHCDICGKAWMIPDYDDVLCPSCGAKYIYDEGITLKLTKEDLAAIRERRGIHDCVLPQNIETSTVDTSQNIPCNHEKMVDVTPLDSWYKCFLCKNCGYTCTWSILDFPDKKEPCKHTDGIIDVTHMATPTGCRDEMCRSCGVIIRQPTGTVIGTIR